MKRPRATRIHTVEGTFRDPNFALHVARNPEHTSTQVHKHTFHELVVIMKGTGKHSMDNRTYRMEAGDVFVITGDMVHAYDVPGTFSLINILFDPRRLGLPLKDLRRLPGYHALFDVEPRMRRRHNFESRLRLPMDELGHLAGMVAEMEEELTLREPGYRFMATTHLMHIIGYLSRCYTKMQLPKARPVMRISEVLSYMEHHYDAPLTLEDLTKVAHMSQTSLMRTFREVMGRSPIDYLIRLRVSKASQLLASGDVRVTEAALQVGFSDSNYFSRQFRKVMGIPPREYARKARMKV